MELSNLKYLENGWVLSGEIVSEQTIDVSTVHIKIYDALEHYEPDFDRIYTYNLDYQKPFIEVIGNTQDAYYRGSGNDHLAYYGFQYSIVDKKILFKIAARGLSSNNLSGYYDKVKETNSNKVGFNIAIMSVSFNDEKEETFKLFLSPKFKSSKPFRYYDQDTYDKQLNNSATITCSLCNGTGELYDDITCPACGGNAYVFDRIDFNYGSQTPINVLYVNNHNKDCSATYTRKWNAEHNKYEFVSETSEECWKTPKYGVIVSAYFPSYVCDKGLDGELLPTISSTLTNDLNNNNNLAYEQIAEVSATITAVKSTYNGSIEELYKVYLYKQDIEITNDTAQKIRNNVVRFGVKTNND